MYWWVSRCVCPEQAFFNNLQASLQYAQMKVRYKSDEVMETLLEELATAVRAVDSDFELLYRSFTVEYTSHLTLSAADHVHAVWAHLLSLQDKRCKSLHEGFWCVSLTASLLSVHPVRLTRTWIDSLKHRRNRLVGRWKIKRTGNWMPTGTWVSSSRVLDPASLQVMGGYVVHNARILHNLCAL